jgi:uncharacterized damage-inducible protein DinB
MSESERIADQLKRSLDGETWHGPAVMELLEEITAEQAAARPLENGHNIWELVGHLTVWAEIPLARFKGENPVEPSAEENFPAAPDQPDEGSWSALKERLRRAYDALYAELDHLDEAALHKPRGENLPSVGFVLYGLAQHNAYHGGQIALLKKAL